MSSYKLKKWYPSLPKDWKVGMLVTKKDKDDIDYNPDCIGYYHYKILCIQVENNPEFWEKVVEKDYEILSFIAKTGDVSTRKKDGKFSAYGLMGYYAETVYLLSRDYCIHSIKRLSDRAIFSIGESINTNFSYGDFTNTIDSFTLDSNNKLIITTFIKGKYNTGKHPVRLKNLKKIKTPLFKTEDGVDIYEGMEVIVIHPTTLNIIVGSKTIEYSSYKNWLKFSTKEAAEEFILMNKPCLCLNDIQHLLKDGSSVFEILKVVVKGRI